jgi:flagellar biosynthesis protein FlhF
MPLETYTGRELRSLMALAEADFGPEAVMVQVKRVHCWDGSGLFELVAGDAEGVRHARRRYLTLGNSPQSTNATPDPRQIRRARTPGPATIAVVGPTGSGKTTTIAKLACSPRAFGLRRTGLVTLDTYRIGAIEQLRTYAEIAQKPFQVVHSAKEVEAALDKLHSCEVVIVDTPGWGPRNHESREAVEEWLRRINPDEVHLTIPVGWAPELIRETVTDYEPLGVTHLLPTKLDELPKAWVVFDVAAERRIPMRWITDGQEVPEDIRPARPRLLAALANTKKPNGVALETVA